MVPDDLSQINLTSALSGAKIAYFDARYTDTARLVAQEVIASVVACVSLLLL